MSSEKDIFLSSLAANFKFERLDKPFGKSNIFPVLWRNYMEEIALTLDHLVEPRSFYWTDPSTNIKRRTGYIYKLITNFAEQHNITLQL